MKPELYGVCIVSKLQLTFQVPDSIWNTWKGKWKKPHKSSHYQKIEIKKNPHYLGYLSLDFLLYLLWYDFKSKILSQEQLLVYAVIKHWLLKIFKHTVDYELWWGCPHSICLPNKRGISFGSALQGSKWEYTLIRQSLI